MGGWGGINGLLNQKIQTQIKNEAKISEIFQSPPLQPPRISTYQILSTHVCFPPDKSLTCPTLQLRRIIYCLSATFLAGACLFFLLFFFVFGV